MFCMIGIRNCTLDRHSTRTPGHCARCGFNLDEYNRRIADLRAVGLERIGKDRFGAYVWGYKVKHGPERMKRYEQSEQDRKEEVHDGV